MEPRIIQLYHLLQFSDATFPVGTFSFSNGLETATYEDLVTDARSLKEYCKAAALQAAFSDGIAALQAYRATARNDYKAIMRIDRQLMLFKMNDETRLMLQRMGKKLAELGQHMLPSEIISRWLDNINSNTTPGTYPVAQGIIFSVAGLTEKDLFASHQYGVVNMILGAALRCVRVSHYDTQKILYDMAVEVPALYEEASTMTFEDMNSFVPEIDIMASLHEKGNMRMFMS